MGRVISATEARVHFGEIMRQAIDQQQPVIVARDGKPAVVILAIDTYERLVANQQATGVWRGLVEQARAQIARERNDQPLPDAATMVRLGREERDDSYADLR